jgi:hypothetical protein
MKTGATLLVDKHGKAQRTPGVYRVPKAPLVLVFVDAEGESTAYELAPTEALEIARHLLEAAGMTPGEWMLAAEWCAEHAQPHDETVN